MTITPVRLQLSRTKGFKLQDLSLSINGMAAVNVTRNGDWGNPFDFRRSEFCWIALSYGCKGDRLGRQEASVRAFTAWIDPPWGRQTIAHEEQPRMGARGKSVPLGPKIKVGAAPSRQAITHALRNKNLACFCRLCPRHKATGLPMGEVCPVCEPCHSMPLMLVANR